MSAKEREAAEKVSRCIVKIMGGATFYASILMSVPIVCAPWLQPATMATDMKTIYYHPDFVLAKSPSHVRAVLVHEALHIAYLHGLRRGLRDPELWNISADYAINLVVRDHGRANGLWELPPEGLLDEKYYNWSADAIYEDQKKKQAENKDKIKVCLWGGVMDPKNTDDKTGEKQPMSEPDLNELEAEIKIKIQNAAAAAKAIGDLPAGLEVLIEAIHKPVVNWHQYIPMWLKGNRPDNYTWQRPNKVYMANYGIVMPTLQMTSAGNGLLSFDTSGSVSDEQLRRDASETVGLIETQQPSHLWILQHDSVLSDVDEWEPGMDFTGLHVKHRGGTRIRPIFDWIKKQQEPIDWWILYSDMEISDWPAAPEWPDFPVLLCSTGRKDTSPANINATYIDIRDPVSRL